MEELGYITLRMVKVPLPENQEEELITNLSTETFDCQQIAELKGPINQQSYRT